jgi:hypothetical protein
MIVVVILTLTRHVFLAKSVVSKDAFSSAQNLGQQKRQAE